MEIRILMLEIKEKRRKALYIPEIIEQYAEEADFIWSQRSLAITAPHYTLSDIVELDKRLEAYLDGLRIAGDSGWEICNEVFGWEEAGEIFTGASLAVDFSSSPISSRPSPRWGWLPGVLETSSTVSCGAGQATCHGR